MSAQNAHQLESAVHVFYVKALTKILQNVTSKNKELKDQCNMVLTDLKKLEKEKQNIHIELVSNPNKYFKPLELACATKKPQIMETALDCLQKLMAHKCIDTTVKYYGDQSKLLIDVMVATICNCFEPNQDDSVQLQIMKALLTAVTSCDIKGKTVRVTVKTSFNIHLVSKSAINQKTAKATLTQMLNVIFQRMESKKGDQSQNIQLSADDMNEIAMDNANTESVSPTPVQSPAKTPASPVVSDDMPPEVSVAMFVKSCLDNVIAANDAPVKKNTVFQNQYHLDAYFIFGALCRLSMKKIPPNAPSDSMEMRSRILSLQLIHSVLENSGPVFRSTESFITDIKQFLCLSLLKNCVSAVPSIFHLSLSIFQTLIIHFKEHLKNEIGMFFTNVFLRILESNNSSYQHKILVIEVLNNICLDSQTLVDLFVNYDCALESLNIYESLVADLSKVVQQAHAEANWVTPQQESAIKQMGLKTIYTILKSLVDWMHKKEAKKAEEEVDTNQAMFDKLRQTKQDLKESIIRFNTKPKDGIEYLINAGQLKNTPADIASFLYTEGLDKKKIGEYVGSDQNQQVLAEFAKLQNFKQMDFEASIRSFLNTFRLPGEGQQIDRIMQKFAEKYFQDNSDSVFTNADAAYVFAYSVIMLNTELHSPAFNGKKRMTVQEFIKNNETVNDGSNLPEEYLTKIYNGIKNCEIKLKDEQFIEKVKEEEPEVDQNISTPKKRLLAFDKEGAKIFKVTKSMFNETWKQSQISNNSFYFASNSELVKPMLEVSANAVHQALQYMFEQSEEPEIIKLCLDSFEHATHISAHFGLNNERNNFVTSIAKFTCLSNVTMMKQKNIDCTKLIMKIALQEGNNLKSAWQQVLTCVSQLERVYSVGTSGSSADFVVDSRLDSPAIKKSASSKSLASAKVSTPAASGAQKKPDTPNMPKSQKAPPNMEQISSQTIMSQIDATILDKIFVKSADLDDDAIVHFVKGLCSVSHEELAAAEPRKFSLQKLIEVAHYNLSRIKIVWSRIWVHMAEHFITVGCPAVASANGQMIAIHAIDSLRQLAMKFLEQDELANYHFQRDFLKPFLQIMEKSQNVEIRELVVQCIGQMILKRASNIKSGWKTILQVLKKSAADGQETVVQTGFQYTTQIMNEYFVLMSDAFIDLVGCLVQFAKNQIDKRVSIQSIAFLDTCALNIVKGLVEGVKVEKDESGIAFTKDNTHYRVWFPVLTGLSHMVSDIRVEVRIKALQTLHSLLKQHGSLFGSELWKNVFTGVWFPIFADVRMLLDEANGKAIPETEWMQNTCQATLSSMIAVFSDFFDITSFMLGDLIKQVSMCFRQESKLLCTIGLAVFKELVMLTGSKFKPEHWNEICKEVQVLVERMNLSELVPPDDQPQKIKLSPVFLQTKAAIILQFVQLIGDLTFSQYSNMQTSHVQMMLNALDASYKCAKLVNESHFINDTKVETVQKHKVIPINELITQEISSMAIYLNIVFKMFAETTMIDRHDVAEAIISARCIDLLQRYMVKASIIPATPEYSTVNAKEMEALIQIVVLILTGLLSFTDEQFKKHIGKFYPHITNLILSQSTEIRKMLKDVLVRVGKFTPCIAG